MAVAQPGDSCRGEQTNAYHDEEQDDSQSNIAEKQSVLGRRCSDWNLGHSAPVVVCIRLFTSAAIPGWASATLLGLLILSFVALGNFVVLFAVLPHSRGISLANLEEWNDEQARKTSASSD